MSEILLEISGLRIEAGGPPDWQPILHGLDLHLARGEVLGLIGESGAGKSTAGLAAMGVIGRGCRLAGGSIRFDGIDLATAPEPVRRQLRGTRIAYVAQSSAAAFNPAHRLLDQTIESLLAHQRTRRGDAISQAERLYDRLRLPQPVSFGRRFPHQVSSGQLQRAMTAMGMISLPDLIVFDEPTTALDVTTQIGVLAAIRAAVEETGTAAIYISHDLALVAQMAHRIMVLRHGRLVEEAATRTILATPRAAYTRTLLAEPVINPTQRPAAETLLAVERVVVRFGPHLALDQVSITVPRGRTVAVVGESGSGKSTLARVIAGLRPPEAGRIVFAGTPLPPALRHRSRDMLRRIQLVHQSADTALNPRHTVRRLLGRPLRIYQGLGGGAQDRALRDLLGMVELSTTLIDRLPAELSGGQKQRVAIARALAAKPDLIMCDEVTSALDRLVQESILRMLMALQVQTGVAYLFITHDLATMRAIADDVVVMQSGCVVEHGSRAAVLTAPQSPYTRSLLASVPTMDPDWLRGQDARTKIG